MEHPEYAAKGTDLSLGELHRVLEPGHWDGDGEASICRLSRPGKWPTLLGCHRQRHGGFSKYDGSHGGPGEGPPSCGRRCH